MIYMKNNPLQEYHAAAFGLTQDFANTWIHKLMPIFEKAMKEYMPSESQLPQPSTEPLVLMDCTERPVERDTYEQNIHYSGKKKLLR